MSWREIALGDALRIKHGFAFKSEYFIDDGEYVVLTPGNFHEEGGFRLRPGKDRAYSGDIPEGYVLKEGDIIVAMTEQGPGLLGSSAMIPANNGYLHNQRLGLVENLDEQVLNRRFLYYLFNTRGVRGQISGSASGTKVRHTSPERIYRVRVTVPDIEKQARIVENLSAFDESVENNRRRITLLERAARELFREWFVRLRFPGHEHTKIIEGVPEGWRQKRLVDVAKIEMGQSPKSEYYNGLGEGLPFHQGVTNFGFRFVDDVTYSTATTKIAEPGDILFSVRAPVGRVNVTLNRIILGRGLAGLRSRSDQQSFLLYQLKSHFFRENMIGGGAIYAAVTKTHLERVELMMPSEGLIRDFEEQARLIDRQILSLTLENRTLSRARDILFPRLMNGSISV